MSDERTRIVDDPEIVEFFKDDPGGLAIADAITATQTPPRRRGRRLLALAAVVAVLAGVVATLARDKSEAGVIERALAALPADRILHLRLEGDSAAQVVDLRTGQSRTLRHTIDEWFDPRSGVRRVRDSIGAMAVTDVRTRVRPSATQPTGFSDAALAAFPSLYRRALNTATENDVSDGQIGGKPVYWVRFRDQASALHAVAIDRDGYQARRIIFRDGSATRSFDVRSVEILPRESRIPATESVPKPILSTVLRSRDEPPESAAFNASTATSRLGRSVGGRELSSLRSVIFTNGDEAFDLIYGTRDSHGRYPAGLIHIQESTVPYARFGWRPSLAAAAAPGRVLLSRSGRYTIGLLKTRTRFIRIVTSEDATTIAVSRGLAAT